MKQNNYNIDEQVIGKVSDGYAEIFTCVFRNFQGWGGGIILSSENLYKYLILYKRLYDGLILYHDIYYIMSQVLFFNKAYLSY